MVKKKKQQHNEEIYFIGVKEPIEIRRSILEGSRELLQFLQMYEKFKVVRNEKREAVALLKAQMRDLHNMIADLKKLIPSTSLRAESRHEKKVREEKPVLKAETQLPEPPKVEKPERLSEVDRLEAELADIENKLNALS